MSSNIPTSASTPPTQSTSPQIVPWAQRVISLTFQLDSNNPAGLFEGGADTLTVSGLRTFVTISKANTPSVGIADIRVYGLTLNHINTLTRAGTTWYLPTNPNVVSIAAGEKGGTLTTIFTGTIYEAYPDFNNQPDGGFVIIANAAVGAALKPAGPVSFPGPTTVEQALTQIIKPAGWKLQNNGVNVTLASPYYWGTVWQQVQQVVKAAGCVAAYDDVANTLIITPSQKTGTSSPGTMVNIGPQTGMIGYPQFQQALITVRNIFAPNVNLGPTQWINVTSQFKSAQGPAQVWKVDYDLSAETPDGPWEMQITAAPQYKKAS